MPLLLALEGGKEERSKASLFKNQRLPHGSSAVQYAAARSQQGHGVRNKSRRPFEQRVLAWAAAIPVSHQAQTPNHSCHPRPALTTKRKGLIEDSEEGGVDGYSSSSKDWVRTAP